MEKLAALPIDWTNVNWDYLFHLILLVFVCTFIGTALSFKRTFLGCVLTALLFGTAFMSTVLSALLVMKQIRAR